MTNYPDFTQQILQLKRQLNQTEDSQKLKLVGKWVTSLEEIKEQIEHLRKIEQFADKIKKD
ncbi:MAG: hypothetical protein GY793_06775 [Proteobacteria bacterium]|nr:hypothetical protein [Pseudomonadota bacterium]